MDATKNPEYLRATSEAVEQFRAALTRFLELFHTEVNPVGRGLAPAVVPRRDADPTEIARRRWDVARAAGRASYAVPLTGSFMMVEGAGRIDPLAAWQSMTQPKPLVEPDNVFDICDQILGRLEAMTAKAEAEAPPTTGVEAMHPVIWGAAARLWADGHLRMAVQAAGEALVAEVKVRTGRRDLEATPMWQQLFSDKEPQRGEPRLRWPGDPKDKAVSGMREGLRQFSTGVQMTVRNAATHGNDDLSPQDGLERLAALSLLARFVDQCDVLPEP